MPQSRGRRGSQSVLVVVKVGNNRERLFKTELRELHTKLWQMLCRRSEQKGAAEFYLFVPRKQREEQAL